MPTDSHLTWNEITDFTGGLWEVDNQLIPPNGAQTMLDCIPLKQGGLRAWFKPTSFTTTGIGSLTDEVPKALWVHERLTNRSGNGVGNDYYLITYVQSTTRVKVYRMDGTNAETTWTLIKTHATGLEPNAPIRTCTYVLTSGARWFVYAMGAAGSADSGVWRVQYSDGSIAQLTSSQEDLVANYQNRLLVAGAQSATIKFTDAGLGTGLSSNTAPVDPGEGISWISALAAFSPGDLMVFKTGAPIYLVQGDLTNYTVRQMNGGHMRGRHPVKTDQGVAYIATEDGVYLTPDGSALIPMSTAIKPSNLSGPLTHHGHYVLTGLKGYVLDMATGGWFQTSFISTGTGDESPAYHMIAEPGFLYADAGVSPFTIKLFTVNDGKTDSRAESYTWKSPPLRDGNGRQVEVRAVQVYARSYNTSTSTIAVTVGGTTVSAACDASGRGVLTYYFLKRGEELDIQVVAASNASGVPAPDIETVRFAGQPGHFQRPPGVGQ